MATNTVTLDINVQGEESLRRVGLAARGAGQGLNDVAAGSAQADRNIKGAANASSNATKNFSKMSQGMGGLVAAYATVAAQVFALSAAYQFLLNAADFRILIAGQQALTASTGLAYTSITKSIQKATNAQLAYQEAAQAAAIGTAAGLGADQVTRLAELADTISKTLGRDLTDTFNRLVRGITKAEPELLDELGIVLRLKDAQEQYALSVGKSAASLTTYEKTQAVFLATATQGEDKFGALGNTLDGSTNKIRQLGVALGEVANRLKPIITTVSEFAAGALTENLAATITTFGLLAGGVLKQLLPSIREVKENYVAAAKEMEEKQTRFNNKLEETKASQRVLSRMAGREAEGARAAIGDINKETTAARTAQGIQKPISRTMQKLATGQLDPNSLAFKIFRTGVEKELKLLEKSGETTVTRMKSKFIGMTKAQLLAVRSATRIMEADYTRLQIVQQRVGNAGTVAFTKIRIAITGAQAALTAFAGTVATLGMKLLGFLGWVGLAITLGTLLYQGFKAAFDYFTKVEPAKALQPLSEKLTSLSEETKTLVQDLEKMQEKADSFSTKAMSGQIEFFGNAAASIPIDKLISDFDNIQGNLAFLELLGEEIESLEQATQTRTRGKAAAEESKKNREELKAASILYADVSSKVRESALEVTALAASYAKLDPALKDEAKRLSESAEAIDKLNKERADQRIKEEDYRNRLGELVETLNEDIKATETRIKQARQAAQAFSSLSQTIKSYNDRIRGSISLNEVEQSYLDLTNIATLFNETLSAIPEEINVETFNSLNNLKTRYEEVIQSVKNLYAEQKLLNTQKIKLEIDTAELGLIRGTSEGLIKLQAENERKNIALRKKEAELEIKRLEQKFKELRVTLDPDAFSSKTGESIVAAGEAQANLVKDGIESGADYHARKIIEATTGEDTVRALRQEGQEALAAVLQRINQSERARQMRTEAAQKQNTEAAIEAAGSAVRNRADLGGPIDVGEGVSSAQIFMDALQAEIDNKELALNIFDVQTQGSYIKEIFDRYDERAKKAAQESDRVLAPLREIVSRMPEGVDRARLELQIKEQELALQKSITAEEIIANQQALAKLGLAGKLTEEQEKIFATNIKNRQVQEETLQRIIDTQKYQIKFLAITEKYNKLNQERQIQEKFLSLSAGSYADAARESLAVAAATSETNQIAEEIQTRQLRIQQLQAREDVATNIELQEQIAAEQSLLEKNAESYALSKASLEVLKEQVSVMYKIGEAAKSALGEGLTQEFANFLKGGLVDVEKSFLTILQGVGNAVADQMAKMLSDSAMDIFGMGPKSEEQKALLRAKQIAEMQAKIHTGALIPVFEEHARSLGGVFQVSGGSRVGLGPESTEEYNAESNKAFFKTVSEKFENAGKDLKDWTSSVSEILGSENTPFLEKLGSIFTAGAPWINSLVGGLAGAIGTFAIGQLGGSGGSWSNAIIGGLISGATMGFNSWLGGLGQTATSTAFNSDLAYSRFNAPIDAGKGIGSINTDLITSRLSAPSSTGAFNLSSANSLFGFANGGMVKEPTLGLVGEGKYNEAIVPLPDGRSIPVIMQGAGGDRTTVGINVNVNSSGQAQTDTQGQGDRGVAMAQALSSVVQQEIKRQKRPGGLLSPY